MSETSKRHKEEAPRRLNFAVIVCSTSRYNLLSRHGKVDDPSGDIIVKMLENAGYNVSLRRIVPDEREIIQRTVLRMLKSRKIDVIITCGGTGISPSDVTIEAVRPLLEKELEGFGELFRLLSYQEIGSAALLTRAVAGVSKGKVIFCIPGSPNSVKLSLEKLVIPEAAHIIKHARE
ncbi:MAG TPA: molybdenum cofactor biosynthesis protein MoaB [Candidatus Korarchaeota archaeon]|nr:molybdenum cofactor biosynthesis protein MoaB [Candidatus Korarchaeota archaeon]